MKSLIEYIEEGLFNKGASIYKEDFENLKGWVSLVCSRGKSYIRVEPARYNACPAIAKFDDTISSVQIAALDDLFSSLDNAIKLNENKLRITNKQKELILWLGKYVDDKAYNWTKECEQLNKLRIRLAAK